MGGAVKEITRTGRNHEGVDEFNSVLSSSQYTVAYFTATWCGPCRQISPVYQKFAEQFSIPDYLAFAKIDVDLQPELAQIYDIRAMPSFIFFKDGKRVKVNGIYKMEGGNPPVLGAAVGKLAKLAKEKAMAAAEGAE